MSDSHRNHYPPLIFATLALAYVVTGKLGLMLALPPGYASAIFPPAGMALAAIYLAGRTALPWLFLGSLLLNMWVAYSTDLLTSGVSLLAALIIAFASALQAAIGGWALSRAIGANSHFDQVSTVLRLLLIVPLVCLTSATVSVSGLVMLTVIDANSFIKSWMAWWAGDTLGGLVFFPICLVFAATPHTAWRKRRFWVALPMFLTLVLVTTSFVIGSKWEENNALTEFRALSEQVKGQLSTRLDEQAMLLVEARAFFLYQDKPPSRAEFGRYMQNILAHFQSIHAIEWIPRIEDSQRRGFETEQRQQLPNFKIWEQDCAHQWIPARQRPTYYPVTYLEPLTGNEPALGLDIAFSPERHAALALALSQNKLVSTAPVTLVQDKTAQAATLLIYPLAGPDSPLGVVLVVLKMRDFVEKLLPEKHSMLFVRLIDIDTGKKLYDDFTSGGTKPLSTETITFGARPYRLEIAPTPIYWAQHQGLLSYGILVAGLFGIGAFGGFLLLGTGYTARVEMQVKARICELQESEQRFRSMADSAPVLIWVSDAGKLCFWFNKVWLDFTGRTLAQEMGNGWADGVHPDDLQRCLDIYHGHFDRRQPFMMEYRLKRHDGEYRWLTDNGTPRFNHEGRFEGYIGSCIDITEMRRAQDHLQASHDLLNKLSQHVPGVIYQYRRFPDGRSSFPYASAGIQGIYDVSPAQVSEDATPVFAKLHPDDLDRVVASILESARTLSTWCLEYRVNLPQKGERWLLGQAKPEVLADGSTLWYGFIADITERKQMEAKLREVDAFNVSILNSLTSNIAVLDTQGVIVTVNNAWRQFAKDNGGEDMLGANYLEACKNVVEQSLGNEAHAAQSGIAAVLSGELEVFHLEYPCHSPKVQRWFYMKVSPLQGSRRGVVVSHENITVRKQAEIRLQLAASVFSHAREGIIITDAAANIIEVNEAFTHMTGYSREEAIGKNPRMLRSGRQSPEYYAAMWRALTENHYWAGEIWSQRKDGKAYIELLTISAVRDAKGKTQNYVGLFSDITAMKEHQQQLEHIAHYDVLTGLPNRLLLADRLQMAITQSQRRNLSLAVVFLDLDGFKAVNDSYGHAVGDKLLITVGNRMKMALREGDTLARMGGDEFVAVVVDLEQAHDYEPALTRLLQAASSPVTVGAAVLQVSASIGVTVYPQDESGADHLIRHADQAMYQAKQAGKNCWHLFNVGQGAEK
jgi:diguanylate cyclase (GGDEF)-like protein/PAS domain S-box-containing protein